MFLWPRPVGLHAAGSNPTGIDPSAGLLAIASKLACRAPEGGRLVVDEPEGALVPVIFDWY
jgi:hypothetical protein